MHAVAQQLEFILNTQKGERKAVQFLGKHPEPLQYILTEVSLGGDYYMDAVVLNGYSGAWEGYFIEFEPVTDKVFNKNGTPQEAHSNR